MSVEIFKDQKAFMVASGQQPSDRMAILYQSLIAEEHSELLYAFGKWCDAMNEKRDRLAETTEVADACIDIIYVAIGMLHALGLDPQALWNEVQRSNMDKLKHPDGQGGFVYEVRRREDGKILKPDGWTPPNLRHIVACNLEGTEP